MYRTSINFHDKIQNGEIPIVFVIIKTDMGARGYSEKQFSEVWELDPNLANGTYDADGSIIASSGLGMLEYTARLMKVSTITKTISPKKTGLLLGYTQKAQSSMQVQLANRDLYFSKLLTKEPFLTKTLSVYVGFASLPYSETLMLFTGKIETVKISNDIMNLEVVENLNNLGDDFTLDRSSRYSSPLNTNDNLPIVYGNLTDGNNGNWILPCIDTVSYVYCFADHAVLSVANGNSVAVYADGELVDSANYSFDESDNYDSVGIISTITFTTTQENAVISATGSGKNDGASLIENVIDILFDFLTVHNSYTISDFDTTKKSIASDNFESQSYASAGIILSDDKLWDILQDMVGSFLGSIYLNAQGLITIDFETNAAILDAASILPFQDIELKGAEQEVISLVNQIPGSYAYNYNEQSYNSHTDDTNYADLASQGIYGDSDTTSYKFKWCRDKTSVNIMQKIITDMYGRPLWQVDIINNTLKGVHVDVGDYVQVSIKELFDYNGDELLNEFMKVVSVKSDLQNQKITYRLVDTGVHSYFAYIADGTYTASGSIIAGNNRDDTLY